MKIRPALESVLEESEIFRYKFIAVAKLFGLIDREALVSRSMARRLDEGPGWHPDNAGGQEGVDGTITLTLTTLFCSSRG